VFDEKTDHRSDDTLDPEALMIQQQQIDVVRRAIEELPVDFREVIILRELEGLSYKDISTVVGIPIGTVMSRLSRGRERLLAILGASAKVGSSR
jgi:RNA polymerase sigma factor (sigma-70 family)